MTLRPRSTSIQLNVATHVYVPLRDYATAPGTQSSIPTGLQYPGP